MDISEVEISEQIGILIELRQLTAEVQKEFKEIEKRASENGFGLLKQILIDALLKQVVEAEASGVCFVPELPLLSVKLECGKGVVYRSYDEIPEDSVPCPCGNPSHWLIKYEDLRR